MSEYNYGKKQGEERELQPFLDEYEHVTGVKLTEVKRSERPDFICRRNGRWTGIELVKAMRDYLLSSCEIILRHDGHIHGLDAALLVQEIAYAKEKKRASPGWQYPERTILVIQLIGSDGVEMDKHLDDSLMDEMSETGFCEIWIADDSPLEPHSTVQLIGVKPKRWRGPQPHRFFGTKPYG